jgi:hypothetical protein
LSDGTRLEAETAHILIRNRNIVAGGDTLFADAGVVSQTYRVVE